MLNLYHAQIDTMIEQSRMIHRNCKVLRDICDRIELQRNTSHELTSLLPRPNPLMTGPCILTGNGDSGPESGPAKVSRGPSGRILWSRNFG